MRDELDTRIRALEAERLRPIPRVMGTYRAASPDHTTEPVELSTAEIEAARRRLAELEAADIEFDRRNRRGVRTDEQDDDGEAI
jgi:hypothetical protein